MSQVDLSSAGQTFPIGGPSSFPRQPLHCLRHSLVWIAAAIGSHATLLRIPFHRIASQRNANSAHLSMDSASAFVSFCSSLGLLFPLMQPTRGEASSLPIVPLLSFPANFALVTSLSSILSFFLHLTSLQLITASTISLHLFNS